MQNARPDAAAAVVWCVLSAPLRAVAGALLPHHVAATCHFSTSAAARAHKESSSESSGGHCGSAQPVPVAEASVRSIEQVRCWCCELQCHYEVTGALNRFIVGAVDRMSLQGYWCTGRVCGQISISCPCACAYTLTRNTVVAVCTLCPATLPTDQSNH